MVPDPQNVEIKLTRLRDGETWRAVASATGFDKVVVTEPYPDTAAFEATMELFDKINSTRQQLLEQQGLDFLSQVEWLESLAKTERW